MMRNVCVITQCSLPVPTTKGGGVETLAEYMIAENEINPRYKFTVITVNDAGAVEQAKKYKYTDFCFIDEEEKPIIDKIWNYMYRILKRFKIYIPFSRTFVKALREIVNLEQHDLYLYLAGPTTQIPLIAKIVGKDKLLVHLHWDGMGTPQYSENCNRVIAVSDYIANQWRKKACTNAVSVVENCVKLENFTKMTTEEEKIQLRTTLGISESEKVILFVGRIVDAKGIRELIKAFQNVKNEDVVLLIVGSANFGMKTNTPYEKEIEFLINESKKKILFTGFIHQTELYKYYSLASFSVMPSQFQEPAGLVAIEAQATGMPLIATRVGGLPEYCDSNATIIIDKDENQIENLTTAIEILLNDPERCKAMGESGKKFSLEYNTKKYFDGLTKIFDSVLDD